MRYREGTTRRCRLTTIALDLRYVRKIEDSHFGGKSSPSRQSNRTGEEAVSEGIGNDAFMKLYSRSGGGRPMPVEHFTKTDRERVLELLLSQERVVTLLYAKTFPIGGRNTQSNPLSPDASAGAHFGGGAASLSAVPINDSQSSISLPHLAPHTDS